MSPSVTDVASAPPLAPDHTPNGTIEVIGQLRADAARQVQALTREIEAAGEPISVRPAEYAALAVQGPNEGYSRLSPALLGIHSTLRAIRPDLAPLHDALLLASTLAGFELGGGRCRLPTSVQALYPAQLRRILQRIVTRERCDLSDDTFRKDLAILTHRLIPVGAEFASPSSGIPRRVLVASGPMQFARGCRLIASAGGVRPFLELHAHVLALDEFHPEGWDRTYERLAELLVLNPGQRGWMSASWFLDPVLDTVSPRLSYLRQVPARHGAVLLFVGMDQEGRSGALARSPTRQCLFEQGRYVPAIYMRVWLRASVLRWLTERRADTRATPVEPA